MKRIFSVSEKLIVLKTTSSGDSINNKTSSNGSGGIDLSSIEAVFDFDPFSSEDSTNMFINPDHSDIIAAAIGTATVVNSSTSSSSTSGTDGVGVRSDITAYGIVDSFAVDFADFSNTNSFSTDKDTDNNSTITNGADTTALNGSTGSEAVVVNEGSTSS